MPTVLIIDDDKSIRESFRNYLEDYDYVVREAENGRIGLDEFERERPDLILLDLRMPEMDGLEVLSDIRRQSPDMPVIVVSGTGMIQDAIESLRLGAWDYMLKPVESLKVLRHSVEKVLERARLRIENREYRNRLEKMIRDKTERLETAVKSLVESERKILAREKDLRESENLLTNVFESIQDGMIIFTDGLTIQRANDVLKSWYPGKLPLEGRKCHEIFHGNKQPCEKCPTTRCMATGNTERNIFPGPRQSDIEWMEVCSYPIRDRDSGETTGAVEFLRDITEQKRAEEEKKRLEARLMQTQKMEAIGTLAGGIAHDFNNILYGSIGFAEMALEDAEKGSRVALCIKQIMIAQQRAANLVKRLLSFSRRNDQEKSCIPVQPVIMEALELLGGFLPSTIEIRRNIDMDCGPILADPTGIHQVLMNLCTNAYHAMRERGGTLGVRYRAASIGTGVDTSNFNGLEPGMYARISVSDTGMGMDAETQKRIFEPYFTTKKVGEGTGMGLSTVHAIVRDHGGTIKFHSEPEQGTTFHIYFPLRSSVEVHETVTHASPEIGKNELILVVDDEEQILLLLKTGLEELGYRVTAMKDSPDALEIFTADPHAFDAVVTDQTMPKMTGGELAKKMIEIRPDIPIIICTGFSETFTENDAIETGVTEYVSKPVLIRELAGAVSRALKNKPSRED